LADNFVASVAANCSKFQGKVIASPVAENLVLMRKNACLAGAKPQKAAEF
jgi:hypothetical protein